MTHGCLSTKNILKTFEHAKGDLSRVASHKQLRPAPGVRDCRSQFGRPGSTDAVGLICSINQHVNLTALSNLYHPAFIRVLKEPRLTSIRRNSSSLNKYLLSLGRCRVQDSSSRSSQSNGEIDR